MVSTTTPTKNINNSHFGDKENWHFSYLDLYHSSSLYYRISVKHHLSPHNNKTLGHKPIFIFLHQTLPLTHSPPPKKHIISQSSKNQTKIPNKKNWENPNEMSDFSWKFLTWKNKMACFGVAKPYYIIERVEGRFKS